MKPVELLIIGVGDRGQTYGQYALAHPERACVVGLAESRAHYREKLAQQHQIAPENAFADWREAVERPKFADAVIIATRDTQHRQPAIAFAHKGYDILLEKPMAPVVESCRSIVAAAQASNVISGVCHVLRYTPYTKKLKALLDSGLVGDIVSIQHLEPVGNWHYAHSFTRGNWRNEARSSLRFPQRAGGDL